ncbi:MAG: DMT family transporter [bacterium]
MNRRRQRIQTNLSMLLVMLFWGNAFWSLKVLLRELSPFDAATLRILFSSVFYLVALLVMYRRVPLPRRQELPVLFFASLAGVLGYHMLLTIGQQQITSGMASLLVGSSPIFTGILAALVLKERLGWAKIAGILISFAGIFVISWKGSGLDFAHLGGVLIVLAASLSWSGYVTMVRGVQFSSPLLISAYSHFFPCLLLLPWSGGPIAALGKLSGAAWGALLFLTFFNMFLCYILYNRAVRILGAATTASYQYLTPVIALFSGWLILGEPLTLFLIGGAVLVIAGVFLTNRPSPERDSA